MRLGFMLFLLCVMIAACQKQVADDIIRPFEGSFMINKKVDTVAVGVDGINPVRYSYVINNGNAVVFRFRRTASGSGNSSATEDIVFEQPSARVNFLLNDSASLRQANVWLQSECNNCWSGQFLTSGTIEGQKLNETTWRIRLSFPSLSNPIQYEAEFFRAN